MMLQSSTLATTPRTPHHKHTLIVLNFSNAGIKLYEFESHRGLILAVGEVIVWLILTACQPVKSYFVPEGWGIAFIVRSYLFYFLIFDFFFFFFFLLGAYDLIEYELFLNKSIWPIDWT